MLCAKACSVLTAALFSLSFSLLAQHPGRIEGTLNGDDRSPLASVHIQLKHGAQIERETTSSDTGTFHFDNVLPGAYSLVLTATGQPQPESFSIDVAPDQTCTFNKTIPWHANPLVSIDVYSVSRTPEPIENAPAAVTLIGEDQIKLTGVSGQVPNVLASVPGAELTQSGLFDYNFNLRGFNTPLNRRIQTSIDDRTPEIPLLGYQEWSSIALLTDDLQSIEVVSGPSSAVYGANAFNGVVALRTKAARESLGGTVRFTFGQLNTERVEARTAFGLGGGWYLKFVGGYHGSNDFSRSRNITVEYPGLPKEAIPIPENRVHLGMGGATIEKYFSGGKSLILEAGGETLSGVVFLTPTGRVQSDNVRSWSRAQAQIPQWTFDFSSNTRNAPTTPAFGSGAPITEEDTSFKVDAQNHEKWGSHATFTGGVSYGHERVNTAGPGGLQTLLFAPEHADHGDFFAELNYSLTDSLSLSLAGDIAASTLHSIQYSPRVALIYKLSPTQSLRATYNHAFQVANFVELFINVNAGLPINLSGLEQSITPLTGGFPLGLSSVPIIARGNPNLDVEKISSYEGGYRKTLGVNGALTVNYYRNFMNHFITDVLPGINPAYPPYVAPAALPPPVRSIVSGIIDSISPGFTNLPNGDPAIVLSIGNANYVDSQGVEFGIDRTIFDHWRIGANYSWFDFSPSLQPAGVVIHPNAPQHKAGGSVGYFRGKLDANVRYRWVDGFPFTNGLFSGPVHAYNVVDASAIYRFNSNWSIGANVDNLLDDDHYEIFGGDILRRRALGTIAYSWK